MATGQPVLLGRPSSAWPVKLLLGHTVAGWTGTALVVTGTTVAGIAFAAGDAVGLSCGLVIVAFGALAAWLLHLAGWGKATGPRPPGARHWRTRDAATRRGHPGCLGCRLAGRTAGAAAAPAPLRARERSRERAGARS